MSMPSNTVTTTAKLSFAEDGKGDNRRLPLEPKHVIGSYDGLHYCRNQPIVKVGEYAVIDGWPCRVSRIDYTPRGKCGHRKFFYYGIGLLDEKVHQELFGPNLTTIVPTIVEESNLNEEGFHTFFPGPSQPPMVCWVDEDYAPRNDEKNYILTHTSVSWDGELPSSTTKTVWVLPKESWYTPDGVFVHGYNTMTPCLKLVLKERDDFRLREHNKQSFFAFFAATKKQRNTTGAIIGNQDIPEVMELIFDFVCGPPKYVAE